MRGATLFKRGNAGVPGLVLAVVAFVLVSAAPVRADSSAGDEDASFFEGTTKLSSASSQATSQALSHAALAPPLLHMTVTSPFGWRMHPVYKRRMFHRGVDYGAPDGTPVYAAQDGLIEVMAGRGRAGFYVKMHHAEGIETAYAHLLRFMPGLRRGSFIRRGDILGFVGKTGDATGPHLHYEVIVNGIQVDPTRHVAKPIQTVATIR
jgi:murein DD-endopeptidase MepM/ murein hydrolase activator NlpD